MRLIDADAVKLKYRDKIIKSLVDKDREIDLSEYAGEPCKSFDRFIDEIPTVDVLEQIRAEIEHEGDMFPDGEFFVSIDRINEIIDKYKNTDRG
jgi:hypothetical protein